MQIVRSSKNTRCRQNCDVVRRANRPSAAHSIDAAREQRSGSGRGDSQATSPLASTSFHHPLLQPSAADSTTRGAIPFAQRLACTVTGACEATGLRRTKLYELIALGRLDTTRVRRRRLVMVNSLIRYLRQKTGGTMPLKASPPAPCDSRAIRQYGKFSPRHSLIASAGSGSRQARIRWPPLPQTGCLRDAVR
jgi:hypothetical protein